MFPGKGAAFLRSGDWPLGKSFPPLREKIYICPSKSVSRIEKPGHGEKKDNVQFKKKENIRMATMHFKTNAKCAGCVARIGEELDKHMPRGQWSIDLSTAERRLTVDSGCTADEVVRWVGEAGFKAEPLA